MVSVILDNLAEGKGKGESYDESIMEGDHVTREDFQTTLAFAADLAEERHIPLDPGVSDAVQAR
jgi:hypothetical protein